MNIPLELALLLCMGCGAAGVWAGQVRANRRLDPRRNPLRELLRPAVLSQAIDLAARRDALREGSHAVLHGRIDQIAALRTVWNADTREQVHEHIAAVMRAGLRRDDRIAISAGGSGEDNFTILIPGADERAAVRIADRLRRSLAQLRLPQLGNEARLTASFGVAADRFGESSDGLDRRGRRALDAADADHVVPASEIEEIILLPAPAQGSTASAA
jgi:diguanylate cyclase (GGDEF)-like protein